GWLRSAACRSLWYSTRDPDSTYLLRSPARLYAGLLSRMWPRPVTAGWSGPGGRPRAPDADPPATGRYLEEVWTNLAVSYGLALLVRHPRSGCCHGTGVPQLPALVAPSRLTSLHSPGWSRTDSA